MLCVRCGAPEPEAQEVTRQFEFYRDGYFVKAVENGTLGLSMEYFFFRGDKLVERFELGFRQYMELCEAYGIIDGMDGEEILWDIFKRAQEKKFGVVRTFEDDPNVKRIEVRVVPWGRERPTPHSPSSTHNVAKKKLDWDDALKLLVTLSAGMIYGIFSMSFDSFWVLFGGAVVATFIVMFVWRVIDEREGGFKHLKATDRENIL